MKCGMTMELLIYKKFIEENKGICIIGMLNNRLVLKTKVYNLIHDYKTK